MNNKIVKLLKKENDNYIFPFFWLHGEPEETLRKYMDVIYESNIRAVCVESRPHPDFCGEKWWRDMDVILDEARKRDMKVWILDDSHFPTGYANGALAGQPDGLCRQSVCCRIYELEGETFCIGREEVIHPDAFRESMIEKYTMEKEPRVFDDDRLLALYAVRCEEGRVSFLEEDRIDLQPLLQNDRLEWKVPAGKWKVYALHLSRNQGYHRSYINMMDRDSCRVLLDAVYEPHYQHYGEDFGTTIAGFFSDEPELGNGHMYEMDDPFGIPNDYPWSAELEDRLQSRLGKEYARLLALLWETDADPNLTARVRYVYMDTVTKLVQEDFSMQIGTWCREHGVQYIGHLIEDNNHHTRTGSSLGHYFRGLAGQDMAGIDDIGGQVFPLGEDISYNNGIFQSRNGEFYHYILGKLGSSAAAVEPLKKGNSMCEIFGNYGWEEGVRLEKYLADHFLVRGINHYVPHAFSPKEFPDPDCPPHFYAHGHNPQYRHFGCLMAYMNRVCELMSGGHHAAPVAVIYHGEGDWTGEHMTMDGIGHVLADAQIEYDIIPQDVFVERGRYRTELSDGKLTVNTQEYRIMVVPYMKYITKALAAAVEELAGKQIPVLFAGGYPAGICDEEADAAAGTLLEQIRAVADTVEVEQLATVMGQHGIPEVLITPADSRIRYRRYLHEDGTEVYLFVNEGTEKYQGHVTFPKTGMMCRIYAYDAWENQIYEARKEAGKIILEVEPLKSVILVFDQTYEETDTASAVRSRFPDGAEKTEMQFEGEWQRSVCTGISYPEFEHRKEVRLPDPLAQEEPEFSGFVRYENAFLAAGGETVYLEITDAREGVEVFVNDESLGIQIVPVFQYNLTPAVKPGENRLKIEVATTLERQMAVLPDRMGRKKEAKAASGITGEVRVWKVIS